MNYSTAISPVSNLDRLAELRPIDDAFMRVLFRDNLPLAQDILRTLTGIVDLELIESETQRDMNRLLGSRSVVLDVWARDSKGTLYDLELDTRAERASPKRARYHSAAMDVETLDAGDSFEVLPEQYVIFVSENDPFGEGRGLYRYCRADTETGHPLGDETHLLYANGSYRGADALGNLMHDLCCSEPEEMNNALLRERTLYFKQNERGVNEMSSVIDEIREEGAALGRAEERASMLPAVAGLVHDGLLGLQDAITRFGFTEPELRAAMGSHLTTAQS